MTVKEVMRADLEELINEFGDVMCWGGERLGRSSILQHKIDTWQSGLIRLKSRRVPARYHKELGKIDTGPAAQSSNHAFEVTMDSTNSVDLEERRETLTLC